jgi:hypothetical protein
LHLKGAQIVTDARQTGVRWNSAVDRFFPTISSEVMQGDLVGLANRLTEEIDGNQRCYQNCGYQTPRYEPRRKKIRNRKVPHTPASSQRSLLRRLRRRSSLCRTCFPSYTPGRTPPMMAGMAINGSEQVHILGAEMPIMRNAASRSRAMVK